VDFVVRRDPYLIQVEVKYQEQIHEEDSSLHRRSFGGGIVVTKQHCEQRGTLTPLPAPVFLLLRS
jgi:predicted AAA+ superfamily ATPase